MSVSIAGISSEVGEYFCVLSTHSLLGVWFTDIFFHSITCLFILLLGSFIQKNVFNFDEVQCFLLWIRLLLSSLRTYLPHPRS